MATKSVNKNRSIPGHTGNYVPASNFLYRRDAGYPQPPAEAGENEDGDNGYPAYEYPAPNEPNQYPGAQPPSFTPAPQPQSPGKSW